jgi:hypothetical protein
MNMFDYFLFTQINLPVFISYLTVNCFFRNEASNHGKGSFLINIYVEDLNKIYFHLPYMMDAYWTIRYQFCTDIAVTTQAMEVIQNRIGPS